MIGTLTGLRGLATLFVVASGLASAGILPSEFGFGLGQIALIIIVVISGFLLALHHAREPWDWSAVGEFLTGRAKRLLPLYYVLLALSAAVTGWWSDWPFRIGSLGTAAQAILLIDAPGALWMVPAFAQLSVLFVVLWWLWSRGWHVAAVVLFGTLAGVLVFLGHPAGMAVPWFLAGIAIGLAWDARLEPWATQHVRAVSIIGAVVFVLACVNLPAVRLAHGWTLSSGPLSVTWADPLTALIVLTLVAAAAAQPLSLAVLTSRALQVLGRCFYPAYLLVPVLVATLT
jgi:peptidoglycan/LPS O-acetylase OafA/YrhL